ncbi:MAG: hypothetical protein EX271_10715 [Acidimicrobiales bacterium]|nr:hypothetical protein [Hyphomonadaceae bacterium]RZV39458.1 MAG: hypothetical protein EX271_10715 [Acidimicrobiales bacterium]
MALDILKSNNGQGLGVKQLILLAEIICAAVLVFLLFKLIQVFVQPGSGQVIAPTTINVVPVAGAQAKVDRSIVSQFDPFHRDSPEILIVQTDSAPETTLDLKVFGMRADVDGKSSSAVIETPDGKQRPYIVGETIIPGVTLDKVDIDFVILNRNGKAERLSRQGRTEEDLSKGSTIALETLSYSAAQMLKDVRIYPYRENKTVLGYQVRPQRSAKDKLDRYGFEAGDIITAINGESLAQQQVNLPALYKNLKLARYANIQIIRDDVPMTIEVNLK